MNRVQGLMNDIWALIDDLFILLLVVEYLVFGWIGNGASGLIKSIGLYQKTWLDG